MRAYQLQQQAQLQAEQQTRRAAVRAQAAAAASTAAQHSAALAAGLQEAGSRRGAMGVGQERLQGVVGHRLPQRSQAQADSHGVGDAAGREGIRKLGTRHVVDAHWLDGMQQQQGLQRTHNASSTQHTAGECGIADRQHKHACVLHSTAIVQGMGVGKAKSPLILQLFRCLALLQAGAPAGRSLRTLTTLRPSMQESVPGRITSSSSSVQVAAVL